MSSIHNAALDLKRLDLLADGDSLVHRLDARAKVLVTIFFIISVVSFEKHELGALLPYFVFPAVMLALSDLPLLYIIKKIALICPFVLAVGIFNPIIEREIIISIGPFGISGGWLSFYSIIVRSILTVGAGFILVGTTGFTAVCQTLQRLGMPRVFAMQLLFLYRYIFVLTEEGNRVSRAREMRSFGKRGLGVKSFGSMLGHLLLRTWQRAERIHLSMLTRGFTGEFHTRRTKIFGVREFTFVTGWSVIFLLFRWYNVPRILGNLMPDVFQ